MVFEKKEETDTKRPDFSSVQGVAIWKNLDKNGKEYLSVSIPLLNIKVNCFAPFEGEQLEVKEEKVA